MARETDRLTARKVATIVKPGVYLDGEGLRLVVEATGAKRWRFRFRLDGRDREMGLGGYHARGGEPAVSLAMARERAAKARELVRSGRNPLVEARGERRVPTFGEAAESFIADHAPGWRNGKHVAQWRATLASYGKPIASMPVDRIETADVLRVLKPLWAAKPETASRLRGRIERVLSAAKVQGHRSGENPAAWRGHLDHLLPARGNLTRGHHSALPFAAVPQFMAEIRGREAVAALALEFTILTVARTGEAVGATWAELDIDGAVWTIPAERMKAGREHRVPLSRAALDVLDKARPLSNGDGLVFAGSRVGKPLSNMALAMLLRRMGRGDVTVHGFRSAFRDWVGDATRFPPELAEQALAHAIASKTEAAYRRGDALEKRRELMEAWASFSEPRAGGNVIPMQRAVDAAR